MHPCRECGKPVEAAAQFCPWCFALPGTPVEAPRQPEPVAAAVSAVSAPAPTQATTARVPQTLVASLRLPTEPTSAPPPPTADSPWAATSVTPARWPRILLALGAVALVVGLVAAGLGLRNRDGGDPGDRTAATAPLELGDPEWKEEAEVVDRAVLKLEDLGPGWAPEGEGHTAITGDGDREFARCLGVPYVAPVASATSPDFNRGEQLAVGATVEHWPDPAAANASVEKYAHPKFGECQAATLRDVFVEDTPGFAGSGRMIVEPVSPLPALPEAKRFRGRLHIEADGVGAFDVWVDVVSIVRGAVEVTLYQVRDRRPDDAVTTRAVQTMLGRV